MATKHIMQTIMWDGLNKLNGLIYLFKEVLY